jgi:hypothetical protein
VAKLRGALAASAVALFVCALAPPANADANPTSLSRGRDAWERGDVSAAESAYKSAIEKGELSPSEVVESYVRIGCARVLLGKRDQALNAFRAAAVLDPTFAVPDEAGQKATQLANQAKKDVSKYGGISLSLTAPEKVATGKSFFVSVELDRAHVSIVKRLAVIAKEGTSGKEYKHDEATAEHVDFEIPADMALPSASLTVRIDALDSYNNRIATQTARVKVPDDGKGPVVAAGTTTTPGKSNPPGQDDKKGGFWSTPWPYVIGGAVLIGAGTAAYLQFRPTDDVTMGAVAARAH